MAPVNRILVNAVAFLASSRTRHAVGEQRTLRNSASIAASNQGLLVGNSTEPPIKTTTTKGNKVNSELIPWDVKSISGFAGGQDRKAKVLLEIKTLSDTVEGVRLKVEALPELLSACEQVLRASEDGGDMNDIDWNALRSAVSLAKAHHGSEVCK